MNFDFNDEQQEIKRTAHEFLASRFKPEKVRELAEAAALRRRRSGRRSASSAGPGSRSPRSDGGQGLGDGRARRSCCEESGYACAPTPLLGNAGAALVISAAGSDEQRAEWLPEARLGRGDAAPFGGFADGASTLFCDGRPRDVVVTLDGGGRAARTRRRRRRSSPSSRSTRPAPTVSSPSAAGRAASRRRRRRRRPARRRDRRRAHRRSRSARSRWRSSTRRERQQFGRPIGAYQAVSHRCAAMLLRRRGVALADLLRGLDRRRRARVAAAGGRDGEGPRRRRGAGRSPASALQVFGGIGFTWEHDLQFWLKRGRVAGRMLGTPRDHRERVADLSGLGAGEPRSPYQALGEPPRCSRRRRGRGAGGTGASTRSTPISSSSVSCSPDLARRCRPASSGVRASMIGLGIDRPRPRESPRPHGRARAGRPRPSRSRSSVISEITGRGSRPRPARRAGSSGTAAAHSSARHHHQVVLVGPAGGQAQAARPRPASDDQVGQRRSAWAGRPAARARSARPRSRAAPPPTGAGRSRSAPRACSNRSPVGGKGKP